MQIEFNAERHSYTIDGVPVPSVTSVIQSAGLVDFSGIPSDVLDRARRFGTAVHRATELFDKGTLDEDRLDGSIKPYLDAWKCFLKDFQASVIKTELSVGSDKYKYAGMIDKIAIIQNKYVALIDIKTGVVSPTAALQTAAYKQAFDETADEKIERRLVVKLDKTGRYFITVYKDEFDINVFLACLQIKRWKERQK